MKILKMIPALLALFLLAGCMKTGSEEQETAAAEITEATSEAAVITEVTSEEAAAITEATEEETAGVTETPNEAAEEMTEKADAEDSTDALSLIYTSEVPYNPDQFSDLSVRGTISGEELDRAKEMVTDLFAAGEETGTGDGESFGENTVQNYLIREDGSVKIISTKVFTGDPLLDPVMKQYGYQNYSAEYRYPFGVFELPEEEMNLPFCAFLTIDGVGYTYCYSGNEMIYRSGPDGQQDNPETNEFMNSVYKIGCYYGNFFAEPDTEVLLTVYSMDSYHFAEDRITVTGPLYDRDGEMTVTIDRNTVFSPDCETEFFDAYAEGETPFEWYQKVYQKVKEIMSTGSEEAGSDGVSLTSLVGVFQFTVTDGHADQVCGIYWWD